MAGGETSGSAMASAIYFLLKNPEVHRKLNDKVRSAYATFDDIDVASTTKLKYLMAVLKEGMGIFSTASQDTPRMSPGVKVTTSQRGEFGGAWGRDEMRGLCKLTIIPDRILRLALSRHTRRAVLEQAVCLQVRALDRSGRHRRQIS